MHIVHNATQQKQPKQKKQVAVQGSTWGQRATAKAREKLLRGYGKNRLREMVAGCIKYGIEIPDCLVNYKL